MILGLYLKDQIFIDKSIAIASHYLASKKSINAVLAERRFLRIKNVAGDLF